MAWIYGVYNRSVVLRSSFVKISYNWKYHFIRESYPLITCVGNHEDRIYDLNRVSDIHNFLS